MNIQQLLRERAKLAQKAKKLQARSDLSASERREYDRLIEKIEAINAKIGAFRSGQDTVLAAVNGDAAMVRALSGPDTGGGGIHTLRAPEDAQRRRLRLAAFGETFRAAMDGTRPGGAAAEFAGEVGCALEPGGIPLEMFGGDVRRVSPQNVATGLPASGTGVVAEIAPRAFSQSVAQRLGIAVLPVETGDYSTLRITGGLTAAAKAKDAKAVAAAATWGPQTAEPKRISARVTIRAESAARVGTEEYIERLVQGIELVLADLVDTQILTGDGTSPNIAGVASRLTAPDDPTNAVTTGSWAASMAGQVDGLFATEFQHLAVAVNTAVFAKLVATAFTGTAVDCVQWAKERGVDIFTNKRMAASVSDVGTCIVARKGAMTSPPDAASMPAIVPQWGEIRITDPYTDSAAALTHFTVHVLLGDVLTRQPDAFGLLKVKTA